MHCGLLEGGLMMPREGGGYKWGLLRGINHAYGLLKIMQWAEDVALEVKE